ncbi:hypothetical protein PYCCODRAFT_1459876 [Trametes coccinea BRFM310]|uniref:DUF5648 domain-containing protein n=1 Tax=Trametes coccinea (strain BRFM310) TaxID=1353009 RepID=A0A1Y2IJ93_TRAC3|nr:hypothetical protein PYCCODRAFT_1459876 [Trametes coccinea BRFM310]
MQSVLAAFVAVAVIATQAKAVPALASAAVVLDETVALEGVAPTPTLAAALPALSIEARAAEVCGFPVVPLLRAASDSLTDRIFTTDAQEIEAALASGQYTREAIIASVYDASTGPSVPNAVPLYKLNSDALTDHFITTSWAEVQSSVNAGYDYQGITAYVYPEAQSGCAGTVPLYRKYNPDIQDHQFDTAKPEPTSSGGADKSGYFYEGIAAYVFAP